MEIKLESPSSHLSFEIEDVQSRGRHLASPAVTSRCLWTMVQESLSYRIIERKWALPTLAFIMSRDFVNLEMMRNDGKKEVVELFSPANFGYIIMFCKIV